MESLFSHYYTEETGSQEFLELPPILRRSLYILRML